MNIELRNELQKKLQKELFKKELTDLLNRFCVDSYLDIADDIIADWIIAQIEILKIMVTEIKRRE